MNVVNRDAVRVFGKQIMFNNSVRFSTDTDVYEMTVFRERFLICLNGHWNSLEIHFWCKKKKEKKE